MNFMNDQAPPIPTPPAPPTSQGSLGPPEGAGRSPVWLWALAFALLGAVTYLQRPDAPDPSRTRSQAVGLAPVKAPRADALILIGKLMLAFRELSPANGAAMQDQADAMTGFDGPGMLVVAKPRDPFRFPAHERLRSTILAGENLGPDAMAKRLDQIQAQLDPESDLNQDVETLRDIYLAEQPGPAADRVDPADRAALEARHGWFARLALSHGVAQAPVRTAAVTDGLLIIGIIALAMTAVGVAGLTGFVMLILAVVALVSGRLPFRFRRPRPATEWPAAADPSDGLSKAPSSVWLETVVVFLAGFLGLKLVVAGIHAGWPGIDGTTLTWMSLLGQWSLLLTIFWPVFRGMPLARYQQEIGWHRGEGVLKEVGWGVLGYCAGLPLYFAMAIIVVIVMFIVSALTGGESITPDSNKVVDIVEGGTPAMLAVVFLLATVWAPIVEESIFRGALFRHLRRRWPLVVAALGSCMVFAVLHGYLVAQLFIVGTLGFWFALLREWRGSLIAPAVGHFIHNCFVLSLVIIVMSLATG